MVYSSLRQQHEFVLVWSTQTLENIVTKKPEVTLTSAVSSPSHLKVTKTVAFSFDKIYTTAFFADKLLLMKPPVSLRT